MKAALALDATIRIATEMKMALDVGSVPSWRLVALLYQRRLKQCRAFLCQFGCDVRHCVCQVTFDESRCYTIHNAIMSKVQAASHET